MDPLKIQVLGPGCPKCDLVARRVREALAASGRAALVEKVADIDRMLSFGITATPAVVVDGRVRSSGRIPRVEEIEAWIGEAANEAGSGKGPLRSKT